MLYQLSYSRLCSCRPVFWLSLRWSLGEGCLSPGPLGVGSVALWEGCNLVKYAAEQLLGKVMRQGCSCSGKRAVLGLCLQYEASHGAAYIIEMAQTDGHGMQSVTKLIFIDTRCTPVTPTVPSILLCVSRVCNGCQ